MNVTIKRNILSGQVECRFWHIACAFCQHLPLVCDGDYCQLGSGQCISLCNNQVCVGWFQVAVSFLDSFALTELLLWQSVCFELPTAV